MWVFFHENSTPKKEYPYVYVDSHSKLFRLVGVLQTGHFLFFIQFARYIFRAYGGEKKNHIENGIAWKSIYYRYFLVISKPTRGTEHSKYSSNIYQLYFTLSKHNFQKLSFNFAPFVE